MSHLSEAHHCDRMKLLLSSLLLASLCALSSWSVSSGMLVTQSPDTTVKEGETVNITCCWKNETMGWVSWLKNETQTNKNQSNNKAEECHNHPLNGTNCSTLTLTNVKKEDSARYICKVTVDIPRLKETYGKGTVITVKSRDNADEHKDGSEDSNNHSQSVQFTLGVVAPLLLITLICFCCLRRKQAQAAKVIYEAPHFDSETQDMDKHGDNSSTGSSQWCQVPVYESFDYFEHVETKKSG